MNLRSGADVFNVNQTNGAFADEALTVDGGSGDDTLNGGDNVELFFGGPAGTPSTATAATTRLSRLRPRQLPLGSRRRQRRHRGRLRH